MHKIFVVQNMGVLYECAQGVQLRLFEVVSQWPAFTPRVRPELVWRAKCYCVAVACCTVWCSVGLSQFLAGPMFNCSWRSCSCLHARTCRGVFARSRCACTVELHLCWRGLAQFLAGSICCYCLVVVSQWPASIPRVFPFQNHPRLFGRSAGSTSIQT